MGPVRTAVSTAWTDIQTRFSTITTEHQLKAPKYAKGVSDWFSRMSYPALFLTSDYVTQETSGQLGEELGIVLNLVLVHTSPKPDKLEDDMLEYTDCLLELIRDDHTFGGACQIGEFVSSDLYAAAQDGQDLALAMITIRLRTEVEI